MEEAKGNKWTIHTINETAFEYILEQNLKQLHYDKCFVKVHVRVLC